MNILLIGNGFDLAHDLPTRYLDFLEWLKDISYIKSRLYWEEELPKSESEYCAWSKKNEDVWTLKFDDNFLFPYYHFKNDEYRLRLLFKNKNNTIAKWILEHNNLFDFDRDLFDVTWDIDQLIEEDKKNKKIKVNKFSEVILEINKANNSFNFFKGEKIIDTEKYLTNEIAFKIFYLSNNNFWIKYFFDKLDFSKENWIDLECEITSLIIDLNNNKERIQSLYNYYFPNLKFNHSKEIIKILEFDFNRFIMLLEIYLCIHVQNKTCKVISKDIKNLKIECILSFNYTNTYERLYGNGKSIIYNYIHGKADIRNTMESNNMVLGIDEYLSRERKDIDTDFISFKKYYQRIYKGTGCKYKEWVDDIRESWMRKSEKAKTEIRKLICNNNLNNSLIHNLFIFGHSLDVTDRDILRDLILNDNVHTKIFYPDKEELGKKIENLVKVIGQEELIKRTGGITKTIEFKLQKPMEVINTK